MSANIRFLHRLCDDVAAMRRFYDPLGGTVEIRYEPAQA